MLKKMYMKLLCKNSRPKLKVSLADHNPPFHLLPSTVKAHLQNPTKRSKSLEYEPRTELEHYQPRNWKRGFRSKNGKGFPPHSRNLNPHLRRGNAAYISPRGRDVYRWDDKSDRSSRRPGARLSAGTRTPPRPLQLPRSVAAAEPGVHCDAYGQHSGAWGDIEMGWAWKPRELVGFGPKPCMGMFKLLFVSALFCGPGRFFFSQISRKEKTGAKQTDRRKKKQKGERGHGQ